jgi:hypothetical protein
MINADVLENTPSALTITHAKTSSTPFGVLNVTSSQKAPLGRILYQFRLRMRTHKGTPKGSLLVAMILVLLLVRKKTLGERRACAENTSDHVTSGDVTSDSSPSNVV